MNKFVFLWSVTLDLVKHIKSLTSLLCMQITDGNGRNLIYSLKIFFKANYGKSIITSANSYVVYQKIIDKVQYHHILPFSRYPSCKLLTSHTNVAPLTNYMVSFLKAEFKLSVDKVISLCVLYTKKSMSPLFLGFCYMFSDSSWSETKWEVRIGLDVVDGADR